MFELSPEDLDRVIYLSPHMLTLIKWATKYLIVCPLVSIIFCMCLFEIPKEYKQNNRLKTWGYLWLLTAGFGELFTVFLYL